MATLVAGIGVGLFILAFVWVFTFFICLVTSRASGPLGNSGIGMVLLALIVTLVLALLPRGPGTSEDPTIIYDYYGIPRTVLVTLCGFMILVGLIGVAMTHVFEPQKAYALKIKRG